MRAVLPHEPRLIQARLIVAQASETYLGQEIGEAGGPAYDWHDNAGLDAVISDSVQPQEVIRRIKELQGELSRSVIDPYPAPNEQVARLGSLATVATNGFEQTIAIVGQRAVGTFMFGTIWESNRPEDIANEDATLLTPTFSALCGTVIGMSPGENRTYQAKVNRTGKLAESDVTLLAINQTWMRRIFEGMEIENFVTALAVHSEPGAKEILKSDGYDVE